MNWVYNMLSALFGKKKSKTKKSYAIEPKMVSSDVFRVDMNSLRNSPQVKKQIQAAQRSFEKEKATA